MLKERFVNALVTGIDNSDNMIEKARADHPDIDFRLCDISGDLEELDNDYDIVFSNACIQWVPNHKLLLGKLMGLLKKNGVLAVQIPYNASEPIHIIIGKSVRRHAGKGTFLRSGFSIHYHPGSILTFCPISLLILKSGRPPIIM